MGSTDSDVGRNGPKFVFFTDFDGTITMQDSNDYMTDNLGFGAEGRRKGNADVLNGRKSFRDAFKVMMDSISAPYSECISTLLANITLDPGFPEFLAYARSASIPVIILSGGMEPIIRALLSKMVGEKEAATIKIVSNNVVARQGKDLYSDKNGWEIVFRDDSIHGHDKSRAIRKMSQLPEEEKPVLFFAGDGVSDLSAARETDLLFAKKGRDLVSYCVREKVPFTVFEDWTSITATVKKIVDGKISVEDAAAQGQQAYWEGEAGVQVK